MKKLALLCVAVCLALIASVSLLHGARKVKNQYATADAPELGPATAVCVWMYASDSLKCGTLRTGMDEAAVAEAIGSQHLQPTKETFAEGTVEYWQYFGPVDHDRHITLSFTDGRLDAIQQ